MWQLRTKQFKYYEINEKGYIKPSRNWNFSPNWRMLGLQHVKRNEFIPFEKLAELLPTLTLQYKNGNPQYTIVDLDHGTKRQWGDGVSSLYWQATNWELACKWDNIDPKEKFVVFSDDNPYR